MKYVLLDKNGEVRVVMTRPASYGPERIEKILTYDKYEDALKVATEHGNLDVAELRVVTRVRTTTHKHQHIDYCLET